MHCPYLWSRPTCGLTLVIPNLLLPKLPVTNATEDRSNALAFLQPALHHYQPTYLCDHLTNPTPTFNVFQHDLYCMLNTSPDLQVPKSHLLDIWIYLCLHQYQFQIYFYQH